MAAIFVDLDTEIGLNAVMEHSPIFKSAIKYVLDLLWIMPSAFPPVARKTDESLPANGYGLRHRSSRQYSSFSLRQLGTCTRQRKLCKVFSLMGFPPNHEAELCVRLHIPLYSIRQIPFGQ